MKRCAFPFLILLALTCTALAAPSAPSHPSLPWQPLFNGSNLDGWFIVLKDQRSADSNHLIQVDNGCIHMYKDAEGGSAQPAGYLATSNLYANYHFRLEYKWGEKRFKPRGAARRDAGILYHITGKDGVWPRSVECQIQQNDVGDIFTVNTRLTAIVDPATTNLVSLVVTNAAGTRTNRSAPVYRDAAAGGVPYEQGLAGGIRRVIRFPMNEVEGWNTVEVVVRGDEATYIVNGVVNNRATRISQFENGRWVPLTQGRIGLQLEFAEVYYRNVQIRPIDPHAPFP